MKHRAIGESVCVSEWVFVISMNQESSFDSRLFIMVFTARDEMNAVIYSFAFWSSESCFQSCCVVADPAYHRRATTFFSSLFAVFSCSFSVKQVFSGMAFDSEGQSLPSGLAHLVSARQASRHGAARWTR